MTQKHALNVFMKNFLKYYFFFDFEEALTSCKVESFKFTYADTVAQDFLSINSTKSSTCKQGF